MRRPLVIYIWLRNWSRLNFPIFEENLIFFFISAAFLTVLSISRKGSIFYDKYYAERGIQYCKCAESGGELWGPGIMYCLCVYGGGELSNVYANVGAPPLFSYYTPERRLGNRTLEYRPGSLCKIWDLSDYVWLSTNTVPARAAPAAFTKFKSSVVYRQRYKIIIDFSDTYTKFTKEKIIWTSSGTVTITRSKKINWPTICICQYNLAIEVVSADRSIGPFANLCK